MTAGSRDGLVPENVEGLLTFALAGGFAAAAHWLVGSALPAPATPWLAGLVPALVAPLGALVGPRRALAAIVFAAIPLLLARTPGTLLASTYLVVAAAGLGVWCHALPPGHQVVAGAALFAPPACALTLFAGPLLQTGNSSFTGAISAIAGFALPVAAIVAVAFGTRVDPPVPPQEDRPIGARFAGGIAVYLLAGIVAGLVAARSEAPVGIPAALPPAVLAGVGAAALVGGATPATPPLPIAVACGLFGVLLAAFAPGPLRSLAVVAASAAGTFALPVLVTGHGPRRGLAVLGALPVAVLLGGAAARALTL